MLECRADKHRLAMDKLQEGAATYSLALMQPGFHRLQVTAHGKPLLGSPWSIQVITPGLGQLACHAKSSSRALLYPLLLFSVAPVDNKAVPVWTSIKAS